MEGRAAPVGRSLGLALLMGIPLAGFLLLLALPSTDVHWEHHSSHFALVLGVALINVALGVVASEAARLRDDARIFFVSLALLVSSGFLALHALATPGVIVSHKNAGFQIATPAGLLLASVFAAASALDLDRLGMNLRRWQRSLRAGIAVALLVWAVASLANFSPLDHVPDEERSTWVLVLLPFGVAAYAFAAIRYVRLYLDRRRILPLAVAVAFTLLAEALIAVGFSRAWHASWWEWHLLMALAFGTIFVAARLEYRRERSIAATFGGLYLERTLERIDRRQSAALGRLTSALQRGESVDAASADLRRRGFSADEVGLLEHAARELARVDGLLERYVGPQLAEGLRQEPGLSELGGRETEVTTLFADLAGFTTFSEGRSAPDVITMLNTYWQSVVPEVVDREGGFIERFAGDAILVLFNAFGNQPDHAIRAVRAAAAVRDGSESVRQGNDGWPRFRVGVNTGLVVVGNVGTGTHRSFSAIGDTTNVAARLQALAAPGQVVIGAATRAELGERATLEPLGAVELKGKSEPVEAFRLVSVV